MRMLLIAVVLIYGMELDLDHALYWYVAAGIAAAWDVYFYINSPANS